MYRLGAICVSIAIFVVLHLWQRRSQRRRAALTPEERIQDLRKHAKEHETVASLVTLIEQDGAGMWPPRTNHNPETWPASLRPYKDIYHELAPLLATSVPSTDDSVNRTRCQHYRRLMRTRLRERIRLEDVQTLLQAVEEGGAAAMSQECYNSFYCTVAVLRHAYRWGTIPVVKVAQDEKVVDFPAELDYPWVYLQRYFGCEADSGNNTSNVLLNFDAQGERVYKINVDLSEKIQSSEDAFFRIFHDLEVVALPVYYDMALAISTYSSGDRDRCLQHLQNINTRVREVFSIFYSTVHDRHISRDVWLSYCQGFQGWGVGREIDGEYVQFDGLSGNHVLFFQAIDAFLGLDQYLVESNMVRYIPVRQREFCLSLKRHALSGFLDTAGEDADLGDELTTLAKQIKLFRAAHRVRVRPYLLQPAPERRVMTAGKSVLEDAQTRTAEHAIAPLDKMLRSRLEETDRLCRVFTPSSP